MSCASDAYLCAFAEYCVCEMRPIGEGSSPSIAQGLVFEGRWAEVDVTEVDGREGDHDRIVEALGSMHLYKASMRRSLQREVLIFGVGGRSWRGFHCSARSTSYCTVSSREPTYWRNLYILAQVQGDMEFRCQSHNSAQRMGLHAAAGVAVNGVVVIL